MHPSFLELGDCHRLVNSCQCSHLSPHFKLTDPSWKKKTRWKRDWLRVIFPGMNTKANPFVTNTSIARHVFISNAFSYQVYSLPDVTSLVEEQGRLGQTLQFSSETSDLMASVRTNRRPLAVTKCSQTYFTSQQRKRYLLPRYHVQINSGTHTHTHTLLSSGTGEDFLREGKRL